jgi:hypothetical protein
MTLKPASPSHAQYQCSREFLAFRLALYPAGDVNTSVWLTVSERNGGEL